MVLTWAFRLWVQWRFSRGRNYRVSREYLETERISDFSDSTVTVVTKTGEAFSEVRLRFQGCEFHHHQERLFRFRRALHISVISEDDYHTHIGARPHL